MIINNLLLSELILIFINNNFFINLLIFLKKKIQNKNIFINSHVFKIIPIILFIRIIFNFFNTIWHLGQKKSDIEI